MDLNSEPHSSTPNDWDLDVRSETAEVSNHSLKVASFPLLGFRNVPPSAALGTGPAVGHHPLSLRQKF